MIFRRQWLNGRYTPVSIPSRTILVRLWKVFTEMKWGLVHSVPDLLCTGPAVSKSHCTRVPMCTSSLCVPVPPPVSHSHCVPVPLCPTLIVYQSHCVPVTLCLSPAVFHSHCVPVPLCSILTVSQPRCVPFSCCPSPAVSKPHCIPVPLCPSPIASCACGRVELRSTLR